MTTSSPDQLATSIRDGIDLLQERLHDLALAPFVQGVFWSAVGLGLAAWAAVRLTSKRH